MLAGKRMGGRAGRKNILLGVILNVIRSNKTFMSRHAAIMSLEREARWNKNKKGAGGEIAVVPSGLVLAGNSMLISISLSY